MSKIKVIIKRSFEQYGREREIENTLEALQGIVGGNIETFTPASDMVVICNEEGLLKNMPFNCTIFGVDFVGPIIIAGVDGEEFTDCPISFRTWQMFLGMKEEGR